MKFYAMRAMVQRTALLALGGLLFSTHAYAQPSTYPNRPIRFVVPFVAGGPSDVMARTLGVKMNHDWNQPVVIDNRAGAAGQTRAVNRCPLAGCERP